MIGVERRQRIHSFIYESGKVLWTAEKIETLTTTAAPDCIVGHKTLFLARRNADVIAASNSVWPRPFSMIGWEVRMDATRFDDSIAFVRLASLARLGGSFLDMNADSSAQHEMSFLAGATKC
jgi:hypothetical protein